jgi:hypothetical protein
MGANVRTKLEWLCHAKNTITLLEAIVDFQDILRDTLLEEIIDFQATLREEIEDDHSERSIVALTSISEGVSEDGIYVDHCFIQTGIPEIDLNKSKLEVWIVLEEMTRRGYIRQTSQTDEVSYRSSSIYESAHSNRPVSLGKRLRRYFKPITPSMPKMLKSLVYSTSYTKSRYNSMSYTKSHYNWM